MSAATSHLAQDNRPATATRHLAQDNRPATNSSTARQAGHGILFSWCVTAWNHLLSHPGGGGAGGAAPGWAVEHGKAGRAIGDGRAYLRLRGAGLPWWWTSTQRPFCFSNMFVAAILGGWGGGRRTMKTNKRLLTLHLDTWTP